MINKLFNKKYIETCVLNPDLQNMWVPKKGDWFIHNGSIELCAAHEFDEILHTWETDRIKFRSREDCIWIPRQDELQIKLKEKVERFRDMTELKFDFNMRQCIFSLYCHKILVMLSLNDMWLIFFMKSLFGKQWVPERKAWEPR